MTGREFQSLGNLKKYELRVVTLLEYLWWSLIPDDLVVFSLGYYGTTPGRNLLYKLELENAPS